MLHRRPRANLPRMDPNILIFAGLGGYSLVAALTVIVVLAWWRGEAPAE